MAVPHRTCIGCRRVAPADELVRVARSAEGSLALGRAAPGRGAWLCPGLDCFDTARRRRAFTRALRYPIDDEGLQRLRAELENHARIGSRDMR